MVIRAELTIEHRSTRVAAAAVGVLGAVVLAPGNAHAEVADEVARAQVEFIRAHGDRPVAAIRVEGLRRTRPGVVQQWIECDVGGPLSHCDLPGIREQIYRLAIFSDIEVALGRTGAPGPAPRK